MPDYMLVFSVPLLTHDPAFTCYTDIEYLKRIRQALWFILEPLMLKNENYSFGFYQELIQKMKNMKDALKADDENVNHKMWQSVTWPSVSSPPEPQTLRGRNSSLTPESRACISNPMRTPTFRTLSPIFLQNSNILSPRRRVTPLLEG